ncbi:MAG: hypothetical protein JNG49_08480 [Peptostreptococcus stomatis]|uniref:hypothetical protein n=1 Tax=Peptostreptococcus stomatis TaxID=341694 RepID=UPI001A61CEA9|nr:hypothetical protein [Peptostreptococcus stomatis]MBL6466435.1 hypothetical protein [Peptostreptococcus stomatis]
MYKVPLEIPKYCNKCPFGRCYYSLPLPRERWRDREFSSIDGKEFESGTYGYVCNIQFGILGSYEDVVRGKIDEDIKKPSWCSLEEVK